MAIVFLDSSGPAGQVRAYDTETHRSVLVDRNADAMAEAVKELKHGGPDGVARE